MTTLNFTDCEGELTKYRYREIDGMRYEVCGLRHAVCVLRRAVQGNQTVYY